MFKLVVILRMISACFSENNQYIVYCVRLTPRKCKHDELLTIVSVCNSGARYSLHLLSFYTQATV